MAPLDLAKARRLLRDEGLDGWLFAFFQNNDPIAARLLGVEGRFFTRRWFYFIPAEGAPAKIVHKIEPEALDHLPGRRAPYAGWQELHETLARVLRGARRVAMQYSPRNDVPYVSRVDAGTVELVRAAGPRVASSQDLVQALEAVLTPAQKAQHRRTARQLTDAVQDALAFVRRRLLSGGRPPETDVQKHLLSSFTRRGLVTAAPPIVAVNAHSALPHYAPPARGSAAVKKGDWLLVDLWAKPRGSEAVYADITWCAYAGTSVPDRHAHVFGVVKAARDAAVALVKRDFGKRVLLGRQVDAAARCVIAAAGHGRFFTHRTGHSIHREDHGNGAHMDGFETRESRRLLPDTLFSVEPGIYLPGRFGARSEINVLLDGNRVEVTTPPQDAPLALLA